MQQNINFERLNLTDLNMYECGTQDCEPEHDHGPAVRDHFLIHYVLDGNGIFQVGPHTYHLSRKQGFLICPDIITYYKADFQNPWTYSWVGFNGLKAEKYLKQAGLDADNPIFTCNTSDNYIESVFNQMITAKDVKYGKEIRLTGLLYMFLSRLIEINGKEQFSDDYPDRKEAYIRKTLEYIEMNFSRNITVNEIAHHIGLDRSYLGTVFKKYLNKSISKYLIDYRINKACSLMKNMELSISDISRSVGYNDPLLFSKTFHKLKGEPPSKYRKLLNEGSKLFYNPCDSNGVSRGRGK